MRCMTGKWIRTIALSLAALVLAATCPHGVVSEDLGKTAAKNPFYIAPYLQNASPTAITIMWEAKKPVAGRVEYWELALSAGGEMRSIGSPAAKIHKVRIGELKPDTRYGYRVKCADNIAEGDFATAPAEDRPIRFAVIGDSRFWGEYWQKSSLPEHLMSRQPEFALHMGDLVTDGRKYEQWPQHFGRFESVQKRIPIFAARGNHERDDPKDNWFSTYHELPGGEPYSSFDWGNAHFAIVSYTHIEKCASFLDADLAATKKKWKFVAFHYPVYCTGYEGPSDKRKASGNPKVEAILDKHGVDMVLVGHTHIYERSFPIRGGKRDDRNGTVHLIQGGAVGGNYPDWWTATIARGMSLPHYSFLEVGDDRIELRSYGLEKGGQKKGKNARIVEIDHAIRWKDERIPKRLLDGLPESKGAALLDAIENLGAMSYGPAAPALLRYLSVSDTTTQRAAALALERIASPVVAGGLVPLLRDSDLVVRRHVARTLEEAMPPELADRIVPEILNPRQDSQVRVCLLGALFHRAPQRAFRVAMAALSAGDGEVRDRAADVVKRTATAADAPALLEMFRMEKRPYVAGCLAWGLNRIRSEKVDVDKAGASKRDERSQYIKAWEKRD
ncbi:MAG: metallophosphoesterase [bacterium]|nr:metallophosphoesterase [bacterium]